MFHYLLSQTWSFWHPCSWCLLCGKMAGTQPTNVKLKQLSSEEKMLLSHPHYLKTSLENKETDVHHQVFMDLGGIWLLSTSLQLSNCGEQSHKTVVGSFRIDPCWWHFLHDDLRRDGESLPTQTDSVDSLWGGCSDERTRLADLWGSLEHSSKQTKVSQFCCSSDGGMKELLWRTFLCRLYCNW